MARDYPVVIECDEVAFLVATVPSLPGCHTQARSMDELLHRIREAIELCREVEGEDPETLELVGVQRITV
jgi:predicted RNase H-like HicB family nuclease